MKKPIPQENPAFEVPPRHDGGDGTFDPVTGVFTPDTPPAKPDEESGQ